MALLRVLTLGALPAVELVRVVHRARHDEALEPHPSDITDGAREEDVRLLLRSELLIWLWYPLQRPPRLLWLPA